MILGRTYRSFRVLINYKNTSTLQSTRHGLMKSSLDLEEQKTPACNQAAQFTNWYRDRWIWSWDSNSKYVLFRLEILLVLICTCKRIKCETARSWQKFISHDHFRKGKNFDLKIQIFLQPPPCEVEPKLEFLLRWYLKIMLLSDFVDLEK